MLRFTSTLVISLAIAGSVYGQSSLVTLKGKVTMEDGTPPPKAVGMQKRCTDRQGDRPGPLTGKDGSYLWRMEIDYMSTRRCWVFAELSGYESSQVDLTGINPSVSLNYDLETIVMGVPDGDPYLLGGGNTRDIPAKSKKDWDAAIAAMQTGNYAAARAALEAGVAASPKFALAWHNIGILWNNERKVEEARNAFAKAIEADPKMLRSYAALTRVQLKLKDWDGVIKTATAGISADKNRIFPELHVNKAVAQYHLKDVAAAEASINEAFNKKNKRGFARAEYVLGRILEAKGDTAGAKQHMQTYLDRDAAAPAKDKAPDAEAIKAHIAQMGQPNAPEPDLVVLVP